MSILHRSSEESWGITTDTTALGRKTAKRRVTLTRWRIEDGALDSWSLQATFGIRRAFVTLEFGAGETEDDPLGEEDR